MTSDSFIYTNIPYHGNTEFYYKYNTAVKFRPMLYVSSANLYVKVPKCSPRCSTCDYLYPEVCLTCNDAANRSAAPGCACVSGK